MRKSTLNRLKDEAMKIFQFISLAIPPIALRPSRPQARNRTVPVTVDNFIRAETDIYFAGLMKDRAAWANSITRREPARIDNQTRPSRQPRHALFVGVFDLDAGPVTITLPDAGKRFMSMMVIDEDHYVFTVVYGPGSILSRRRRSARATLAAIRTLVDPADPKDVEQVHALQEPSRSRKKAPGQI